MKNEKEIWSYFTDAYDAFIFDEDAETILKHSLDVCPECASYKGETDTLLHIVAERGTPEMIEAVISAGGNVFINTKIKGWTPLSWAICKQKMDNVKKLIELGANINPDDSVGDPILLSIGNHRTEILEILISAGADITYQYQSKDNPWWDALSYAKYNMQDEAVVVLERELQKLGVDTEKAEEHDTINHPEIADYLQYAEKHLGEMEKSYSHEDISDLFFGTYPIAEFVSIDIYEMLPKNKDYGILITSGMSEYPMAETDEGLQYAEVMMKIPKEWLEKVDLLEDADHSWVIEMLHKTANLGHLYDGSYVDSEVIVPYGDPEEVYWFDEDYEFTGVMLCESEDIPSWEVDDNTKIKFYTLVPITEEETELVRKQGSAEVKKQLSSGDVVDMERELLVEPEE